MGWELSSRPFLCLSGTLVKKLNIYDIFIRKLVTFVVAI